MNDGARLLDDAYSVNNVSSALMRMHPEAVRISIRGYGVSNGWVDRIHYRKYRQDGKPISVSVDSLFGDSVRAHS